MGIFVPADVQRIWFRRMDAECLVQSDFAELLPFAEGVQSIAGGSGSVIAPLLGTTDGHPGVWVYNTGAGSAGRVFAISRLNAFTFGNGKATLFESWLQIPILSTVAQRFTVRTGFFSIALPNTIIQGIGFEYADQQNGGRWQAITDDGTETSNDTGVVVVAGDWYKHSFIINADGDRVDFFIDDVFVATNTTNIPSGSGFGSFINMHIMKIIGTTTRQLFLDAYAVFQETGGRE
jgi:hypothetical protein